MQCNSPVPLSILGVVPGSLREERELHDRFSEHRLHGEWFEPSEALLSHIAANAMESPSQIRVYHVTVHRALWKQVQKAAAAEGAKLGRPMPASEWLRAVIRKELEES